MIKNKFLLTFVKNHLIIIFKCKHTVNMKCVNYNDIRIENL